MRAEKVSFGEIVIDGKRYTEDIVISGGKIQPRQKSVSRVMKHKFGHTPLTVHENIPWECNSLIVGTGMYGSLPVTDEVYQKAEELGVELKLMKTREALKHLDDPKTNFVIHVTC